MYPDSFSHKEGFTILYLADAYIHRYTSDVNTGGKGELSV